MTPSTREERLAAIRQKCIEANPNITKEGVAVTFTGNVATDAKLVSRPIRLADVLLAIEAEHKFNSNPEPAIAAKIDLVTNVYRQGVLLHERYWNLRADDLEQQSDETIAFLHSLLV